MEYGRVASLLVHYYDEMIFNTPTTTDVFGDDEVTGET